MPSKVSDMGPRPCTIAAALEVVGDRWSLLIVRELSYDQQKFTEIAQNTGAPRDILTVRLQKLMEYGVLDRVPYSTRPMRYAYRLTKAGRALLPVLLTLKKWGHDYVWKGADPVPLIHKRCGHEFVARLHCQACDEILTPGDLSMSEGPANNSVR